MTIEQKEWKSFRGGRYTRTNLADVDDQHVLVASDAIFPGDGVAHKRPGYTLVAGPFNDVNWANTKVFPTRVFNFQRQSDAQAFVLFAGAAIDTDAVITHAADLCKMGTDGSAFTVLFRDAVNRNDWDFATNVFAAYCNNGFSPKRLIDVAGTMTAYNWGIAAPGAAPTVALGAGSLSLQYGRQYVYCFVSKKTDGSGVTRVSVGPPSPISAHTGKFSNSVVTVGSIATSGDAQVTHVWIFATVDTPFNTTSTLQFAAEITNGTASWGDTLADTSLDATRLAPYDNQPAPAGTLLLEFDQRIAVAGIPGKPDLVAFSGLEETPLGIPQESFPLKNFFNVPGGVKAIRGWCTFNQTAMIGTPDFWFQFTGLSADTFQERDRLLAPGPAGKKCIFIFGGWMLWVGIDKKLWAWNGSGQPTEISWKIARADTGGGKAMENLTDAQLSNCELRVFSFGRYNTAVIGGSTTGSTTFDWFSLWDITALGIDGGMIPESDMFPANAMQATAPVQVGNTPYLFMVDSSGIFYRWPDGFTDAGTQYQPQVGSEFSDLDAPDASKRMRWLDVKTSRQDAMAAFTLKAAASDGPNLNKALVPLPKRNIPNAAGTDPTCLRGMLEQARGAAFGKMLRWLITFPKDALDCEVFSVTAKHTPINQR